MGEKNDGDNNNNNNGGKGKNEKKKQPLTVVLKVNLHCEGCVSKIVKVLRHFEGVESVETESSANKVTVVGAVDRAVLREKLTLKIKRNVDLISSQPKKDNSEKEKKPEKDDEEDGAVVVRIKTKAMAAVETVEKGMATTMV